MYCCRLSWKDEGGDRGWIWEVCFSSIDIYVHTLCVVLFHSSSSIEASFEYKNICIHPREVFWYWRIDEALHISTRGDEHMHKQGWGNETSHEGHERQTGLLSSPSPSQKVWQRIQQSGQCNVEKSTSKLTYPLWKKSERKLRLQLGRRQSLMHGTSFLMESKLIDWNVLMYNDRNSWLASSPSWHELSSLIQEGRTRSACT